MVLIAVEGDITEDSSDPADPQKIAFNRAGRGKKPVSATAENTGSHTHTNTKEHTLTKTSTHI